MQKWIEICKNLHFIHKILAKYAEVLYDAQEHGKNLAAKWSVMAGFHGLLHIMEEPVAVREGML